jgi:ATP/maltotriose-dependent transcriptional regulator MalT
VSAPAWFGKTTLLSDWLAHLDQRQVVAALRSAGLDVNTAVLESLHTASTSAALTALVNDFTRASEQDPKRKRR